LLWNNDGELSRRLITLFNLNYNVQIEKNVKADIGDAKVDIGDAKVDIGFVETYLSNIIVKQPTKEKIKIAYLKFGSHNTFNRTKIAELLSISPTSASVLVTKMYKAGLLEIVAGHGKGKYKFK
jgi:predicted XRE-type DNA-binding protein